jgi:signal transduction histidine kinase
MKNQKIVWQITIVLFFAVLIPTITIGIIIANISQHSVRKELTYSAAMIARFLGESVENYLNSSNEKLGQTASAIPFFYRNKEVQDYLGEIESKYGLFSNLKIAKSNAILSGMIFDPESYEIQLSASIDDTSALVGSISVANLKKILEKDFSDKSREVFILDIDNSLIASSSENTGNLPAILKELPKEKKVGEPVLFGSVKNRPMAYYRLEKPEWIVVVSTSAELTRQTIDFARFRIVLALVACALFTIFAVSVYTSYLYINIRQLFKGIIAVSKGNYDRKIHLIKNFFTPHELLFLAQEFNYMARKISVSYGELSEKNLELARLDEFRTNLVNAISHEFRTPLTSIVGYASRLLRQDIKIDDATKVNSLKTIKQQAQRLSRMVDDILVVPEIESFKLRLNLVELDLGALIEKSILYINHEGHEFAVNIDPNLTTVLVDEDRMIQILVNLFENATKYALEGTSISVSADAEGRLVISNKSASVPQDMLEKLFNKFTRLDPGLTRTTRGVGLGLFIVRGLANAMNIEIALNYCENKGEFQATLVFKRAGHKNV